MRPTLLWFPQAREDLLDIYVAIGLDNPGAAERVYSTIESSINLLAEHPRLGVRRMDIAPSARMLVERPYLILYEISPDSDAGLVESIEIIRILHGHRDLRDFFWAAR